MTAALTGKLFWNTLLWSPPLAASCHSNQVKSEQKFLLLCLQHKRIQHPSGKISLLLDVPARMYSSCKSKLFVGCFILLSSKKKKKRASARPHAAIAEQLLVLIARLKLVYIFLQCTTLSRTGKSCISFLLTMSWFLSHIPWDNLLYEHTELLQENLYGNDTTCQNVQFNNPYNGYPKKAQWCLGKHVFQGFLPQSSLFIEAQWHCAS